MFDTASGSDHTHADHLMRNETKAVHAASGYMAKRRREDCEGRDVFCGITYRRVKGRKELAPEQKTHNKVVGPFA